MSQVVYFDLTEIGQQPYRTGIQRIERGVLRHWRDGDLVPRMFDANGSLRALPDRVIDTLLGAATSGSFESDKDKLRPLIERAKPTFPTKGALLNRLTILQRAVQ